MGIVVGRRQGRVDGRGDGCGLGWAVLVLDVDVGGGDDVGISGVACDSGSRVYSTGFTRHRRDQRSSSTRSVKL